MSFRHNWICPQLILIMMAASGPQVPRRRAYLEQPYFTHKPLDLLGDSIRLVELLPKLDDGFLHCRLRNTLLQSGIPYFAVSYMWGAVDESNCEWIKIDDIAFAVQPNLWEFLSVLRRQARNEIVVLWIDAISIDQQEISERNHQVRRMKEIYENASQVLVWLGPEADDSARAFKALKRKPSLEEQEDSDYMESLDWEEDWQGLLKLCLREYWSRVWIVQEVLLARDINIYCGNDSMSWDALGEFFESLPIDLNKLQEQEIRQSTASKLYWRRRNRRYPPNGPAETLLSLLMDYGRCSCTDVRDRVYALLGLAVDQHDGHGLQVDYELDRETLYFRVLTFCCQPAPSVADCRYLMDILELDPEKLQAYSLSCDKITQLTMTSRAHYIGTLGRKDGAPWGENQEYWK